MTSQIAPEQPAFKDYCLILQIHPEADSGMIDAAYWHLAKRYNEEADNNPLAIAKLDDLNEAYSVMGSPERRQEYFQVRNAVLGIGTLPSLPVQAPEPPPLSVLSKQRPMQRAITKPKTRAFDLRVRRFVEPSWQNTLLVLVFLTLGTSALAASASLAIVLPVLALAMLISGIPLLMKALEAPTVDGLLHDPGPQDPITPR